MSQNDDTMRGYAAPAFEPTQPILPVSGSDPVAPFLSLADKWMENERVRMLSDERIASIHADLEKIAEGHAYSTVRMAFMAGAILVGLAFALIFTGQQSIGQSVLQATLTTGLGVLAGYGWGKQKANG